MDSRYRLEATSLDERWDAFAAKSPNATVFSLSDYLAAIRQRVGLYYIFRNQEIRGALVVPESDDGENAAMNDLIVYAGVLFPPVAHNQNRAQITTERFELCEAAAASLPGLYKKVQLALSPGVTDIRAFLWHNYGQETGRYIPDVRYTAIAPIAELASKSADESDLFAQCSSARRQEVRYAAKKGVTTAEEFLPDEFTRFYAMTMSRQDIAVPAQHLEDMGRLVTALGKTGKARMFVSRAARGEIGSMAVMALDPRRAYYLFGASDPALRDSHCGSAVIWDAFAALAKSGIAEVDMEGVNSPKRGWFKLSFGPEMRTYYELSLR